MRASMAAWQPGLSRHGSGWAEERPGGQARRGQQTREQGAIAMAGVTISLEEIRSAIENYVTSFETKTSREEVGIVTYSGDGIARVEGLPSTMTNELLDFPGGVLGVALNLDVREIGAVILGNFESIEQGQEVN